MVIQHINDTEVSKKAGKKKKKSRQKWRKNQENFTLATGVSTTDASRQNRFKKSDPAKITCYHYNKKGYYINRYMEPKN